MPSKVTPAERRQKIGIALTRWRRFAATAPLTMAPIAFAAAEAASLRLGLAIGCLAIACFVRVRTNTALTALGGALAGAGAFWLAFADATAVGWLLLAIGAGAIGAPSVRVAVDRLGATLAAVASIAIVLTPWPASVRPVLLIGFGLASLTASALVVRFWGKECVRDLGVLIFKTLYRLEVRGLEHAPGLGERIVITPNHVSLLDGPMMHVALPIASAFAIDAVMSRQWWVRPFLKVVDHFPLDPAGAIGLRRMIEHVRSGAPLVIFPEGRVSVTGGVMKVYAGAARIAEAAGAQILPVRIEGPQRSPFGFMRSSHIRKVYAPKATITFLPKVDITLDPTLKGKARRQAARGALREVMIQAAEASVRARGTLWQALAQARRDWDVGAPAIADPRAGGLGYRDWRSAAQKLAVKLAHLTKPGEGVGLWLPNANLLAEAFFALQAIDRAPTIFDVEVSAEDTADACRAARIEIVLVSRRFAQARRRFDVLDALLREAKLVDLDDWRARDSLEDSGADSRASGISPLGQSAERPRTASHDERLGQARRLFAQLEATAEDRVFLSLSPAYPLGLIGGLLAPLARGVPLYFYPQSLPFRLAAEFIYQSHATIVIGSADFVASLADAPEPYDLRSVRAVLAAGGQISDAVRATILRRFGLFVIDGDSLLDRAPS